MNLPDKLTFAWVQEHAQLRLVGAEDKWRITAWNNVVCLKIRGPWTPDQTGEYAHNISGIPGMLGHRWEKIYLVFDVSDMEFRWEDAHRYMRSNWLKVIDREDLEVYIVEKTGMRRGLWQSLYTLLGKQGRVKMFAETDEALACVQAELAGIRVTDRIGEFLVRIRAMTAEHVEEVLWAQKAGDSRRFGEIAIERGYINDDAIKRYVDYMEKLQVKEGRDDRPPG